MCEGEWGMEGELHPSLNSICRVVSCCTGVVSSCDGGALVKKILIRLQPIAVNLCISARIMTCFGLRIIDCKPKLKVYF
jgi:hypothetical protein